MKNRQRKIIRIGLVMERVPYCRQSIARKARDPNDAFPTPVQIGPHKVGWYEDEITAWLESRPRVSRAAAATPAPAAT